MIMNNVSVEIKGIICIYILMIASELLLLVSVSLDKFRSEKP
jgi:hypothetical protein